MEDARRPGDRPRTATKAAAAPAPGEPVPGAVSTNAEPPVGSTANPWSEPAFGRRTASPKGRPDTVRGAGR